MLLGEAEMDHGIGLYSCPITRDTNDAFVQHTKIYVMLRYINDYYY